MTHKYEAICNGGPLNGHRLIWDRPTYAAYTLEPLGDPNLKETPLSITTAYYTYKPASWEYTPPLVLNNK